MNPMPMLLALLVPGIGQAPAQENAATLRWEYRVLSKQHVLDLGKQDLAAGLNALGDAGWELAAVDAAYIFKRPRDAGRLREAARQRRMALIAADVDQWRERVAWAERMARKGFLSAQRVEADRARLQAAEAALDRARQELLPPPIDGKGAKAP